MEYPYVTRNIHQYLIDLKENYAALAIIGARQVGKTTLAKSVGTDFLYLDLEKGSDFDRLSHDPELFFKQHPSHVIFDEAQELPELFPTLRSIIDEHRTQKGRFILTGSSSPELLSNISETLAGRVAIIELGTLKANEYYGEPLSDFYKIFHDPLDKNNIEYLTPALSIEQVQNFWFMGGYPEPLLGDADFFREWMIDYQNTYVNRDIAKLFPRLDKVRYRRFLHLLGHLSSKMINKSDLARTIAVSQPTISDYLDIASGTFLWRQLLSYQNNLSKGVVKMPRGHIRDTGLLHAMLHIGNLEQLQNNPIAGFSFEAYVIEEILKGLQDARIRNVEPYYYRTRSGAEVDLVIDGPFGILPIEIKYSFRVAPQQLRALSEFIEKNKLPFGMVVNLSNRMEWLTEKIIQVPAGCL